MNTTTSPRRITSKGQVTLPAAWRKKMHADAVIMQETRGVLEIRAVRRTSRGDLIVFNAERDTKGRGIKAKALLRVLRSLDR